MLTCLVEGVLLDMGCHSIEFARWVLGKPKVKSVTAQMGTFVHKDKTLGEDHSICMVEFENGALAVLENSWAKTGGIDDRCEFYGDQGNTSCNLIHGNALITHSLAGYGYAVEKAETTRGWTFTGFEEEWNYGFPQEMQHFINVVKGVEEPIETGEDGLEVLKVIYAGYQSAGEGRRIEWPYNPPEVEKPIDLWLKAKSNQNSKKEITWKKRKIRRTCLYECGPFDHGPGGERLQAEAIDQAAQAIVRSIKAGGHTLSVRFGSFAYDGRRGSLPGRRVSAGGSHPLQQPDAPRMVRRFQQI